MVAAKKIFLPLSFLAVLGAPAAPAHAWTMAFSETQNSPNLALEVMASAPQSAVRIEGATPREITYAGWSPAALPESVRQLHGEKADTAFRAEFANFLDYRQISLVDMDAAVAGHLLASEVDVRSRFDMPALSEAKWADMRPRDDQGRVLTWEAVKRVKSWLGGTGATMRVASLDVPEPPTGLIMLAGLLPLLLFARRLRSAAG